MSIFDQALQAFNIRNFDAKLHTGDTKHIFLNRSNGNVILTYQKRDEYNLVRKTENVKCGFFSPNHGWVFSLNRRSYARWVGRTGHKIAKKEKTFYEKTEEWRKSAAGLAYQDLPPSKETLAELRRHKMI